MFRVSNLPRLARSVILASALMLHASAPGATTLSLSLNARTADEARALQTAIALYSIRRDIRAGADVRQAGRNHVARVRQSGPGNQGIIRQRGQAHEAHLTQTGGHNAQVILQLGRGAHVDLRQTGGQAGVLIQFSR